ncbi:MAG: family 20 glycosylhydrolase, partial [Bryobacteraceae bacterium]
MPSRLFLSRDREEAVFAGSQLAVTVRRSVYGMLLSSIRLRLAQTLMQSLNRFLLLAALACPVYCQAELPLMPLPAKLTQSAGESGLTIRDSNFFPAEIQGDGAADPRVSAGVLRTLARLSAQTGIPIEQRILVGFHSPALLVSVDRLDHQAPQALGDDESYHLSVTSSQARIDAPAPLGALRGLETFLQLVRLDKSGFSLPAVEIQDAPRFPWRGLSLDSSRHFIPVAGMLRTIDGMAAVKLNVLHWHLSDDEGFRVESKKYPKLHELGSEGLYYTQAEIRDIIAYARERGVRIVPEFDIPGHSTSWFAAYPELASGAGPYSVTHEQGKLPAAMDPTRETTYEFLDGFLGEMAALFPDEYSHIGGDEVDPNAWKTNPRIQAYMKSQQLAGEDALQGYFTLRVQQILTKYGKHMVGWDEILRPDIPKNIVIQSWRGQLSLADAARLGYQGILSAGWYLDLMQPAWEHYAVDPMKGETAGLNEEQRRLILGGEAAMWEEIATAENLDAKLWPRLAAIAERLWSAESVTDVESMYRRMGVINTWLEWLDLRQRSGLRLMRARLAGTAPTHPLEVFASILEPVKGYKRIEDKSKNYNSLTPFNRLVDSIPPESDTAREFRNTVDVYLAGGPDSQRTEAALRSQLQRWSDNVPAVLP